MNKITIPAYLQDDFLKIVASCNIENKLSFLDKRCIDKLTDCIDAPTNDLFKRLWHIFNNRHHVAVFCDTVDGQPHDKDHVADIFWNSLPQIKLDVYQETVPFFTNTIKANTIIDPGDDCITNVGMYFHTFKCLPHPDLDNKAFLNEQISWTIEDEKGNCIIKKIHDHLSTRYEDYRAIYATYSGNKSIHFHTEWDIGHLRKCSNPQRRVRDDQLRYGLQDYWEILDAEITAIIKKHANIDIKFDEFLRIPDIYRRLSWGKRYVELDNEFFNVGAKVPQIELYSKIRKRHLIFVSESCLHRAAQFHLTALDKLSKKLGWDKIAAEEEKWLAEHAEQIATMDDDDYDDASLTEATDTTAPPA